MDRKTERRSSKHLEMIVSEPPTMPLQLEIETRQGLKKLKPSLVNERCFEAELNTEHIVEPKKTDPTKLAQ